MAKWSKSEKSMMKTVFDKMHKVSERNPQLMETDVLIAELEKAPVTIVEYDGLLGTETTSDKEVRMRMEEVYDNTIKNLVAHLRTFLDIDKKSTKWEVIFTALEHIMPNQKIIEQAEEDIINKDGITDNSEVEEPLNNQGSSDDKSDVPEVSDDKESTESTYTEPEDEQGNEEISEDNEAQSSQSSGNAQDNEQALYNESNDSENENKNNLNQEEKIMGDNNTQNTQGMTQGVQDLLKAANAANGGNNQPNPSEAQKAPEVANVTSAVDVKEAQKKVLETLGASNEDRNNWTRENTVSQLISTQKPNALRVLAKVGKASKKDKDSEMKEDIQEKLLKFISLVTGRNNVKIEDFEKMDDAAKYANVVKSEGAIDKAKEIYKLYKELLQDPAKEIAAYIPAVDKISYPVKGYVLNGRNLPTEEFIVEIIDNGTGAVYGEGSMNAEGHSVGEHPVVFSVGVAKRKESTNSEGVAAQTREIKVPVIKPKNKKEFTKDPSRVKFLFNNIDNENTGTASFKAAITIKGETVPATISVYTIENNKKVPKGKDKNGKDIYKTKVASLAVFVPVDRVIKTFDPEFTEGDAETAILAAKWGIPTNQLGATDNFGDIKDFSSSPVFSIFAEAYAGALTVKDNMKHSDALKTLKAVADKQAEEDAQASVEELN